MKTVLPVLTAGLIGLLLNSVSAQSQSFETYMNPVIPGDHPDATVTRIGNDFYTTGSSFNVTPVIYHSTDLVHWEAIAQPVKASWSNFGDIPGGGCWGGQTVFQHSKYWNYFSRANTMYFVSADDPAGPWSDPVMVTNPPALSYSLGYDNSIFIDDNNKWYLVIKNGQPNGAIVELGIDGQPDGAIFNLTWLNPAPDFPYSWAEGPVMWKHKGYYYYSFARDLAGGQKVMRSLTLTAEESAWEMLGDFFNETDPLKPGSLFANPNHSSAAVSLDDSTYWVIHPLYAKGEWRGQGRQGLLNEVHYDAELRPVADYPVNRFFTAPDLPGSGIPWMVPKSDFFNSATLNPEWSFLGYTLDNTFSLSERPGWLRLSPKSSSKANTVIKNDGEHNYSLITHLEFNVTSMNDQAGIQIMRGDETRFVKLYSSVNDFGHKVIAFSFDDFKYEAENTIGNNVWLKIVRINHLITGYYSRNGIDWLQVGGSFDISEIDSYSDYSSFTGTRQGLFVNGSPAYFDLYIYRDAYTPILAECPANQFGTIPTSKVDGVSQLDSIHPNDWALYAGVEFGNDDYLKRPTSVKITAACDGTGGTVEVWLDSINTGTKISECVISGTGGWNSFETFTASVDSISGRHDVYLFFKGSGSGRLFSIKWIEFIALTAPEFVSASVNDDDTIKLYLSQTVIEPALPSGLSVQVNGSTQIPISAISLQQGDSSCLVISVGSPVSFTDEITISYTPGNITNTAGISLAPFSDLILDNLLPGAIPKIKTLSTRNEGDTIWLRLSKKMDSPSSGSGDFAVYVDGQEGIPVISSELSENDSSTIILVPSNRLYYEDRVSLSYSGTSVQAANGGVLPSFSDIPLINLADGYPPVLDSASIRKYGSNYRYIDMYFNKPLMNASAEKDNFSVNLSGVAADITSIITGSNSITLMVFPYIQYGNVITVSYSGGNVRTRYNGKLQEFTDYNVPNSIPQPEEIYAFDKEAVSDVLVFPNPSHSGITINWEETFNAYEILNITGESLINGKTELPVRELNLSVNLRSGIYILRVNNKLNSGIRKIIIE
jgi:xylan 1,4-beta-xylosidase